MGNSPVYLSNNQNTASSNNISQAKEFSLSQNYPNPFNPSTKINYTLGKDSKVSLKIYDINGKEVANLIDANQSSGNHTVTFDGKNLSSGTYFYTLSTDNGYTKTLRMTIAK
jgi:flagellar hook assembly protein FlgD